MPYTLVLVPCQLAVVYDIKFTHFFDVLIYRLAIFRQSIYRLESEIHSIFALHSSMQKTGGSKARVKGFTVELTVRSSPIEPAFIELEWGVGHGVGWEKERIVCLGFTY